MDDESITRKLKQIETVIILFLLVIFIFQRLVSKKNNENKTPLY